MNNLSQFITILICTIAIVFLYGYEAEPSGKYWIKVIPTVAGPFTVDVEIETNIPGALMLSANIALSGQKEKDSFIGTQFKEVPVKNGKGRVKIDGTEDIFFSIGSILPSGQYDVEVAFHPRWPKNKSVAKKQSINNSVIGKATIKLKASGISVEEMKEANELIIKSFLSKIKILYLELMQYKDESEFHQSGFGVCCKYHKWLIKVNNLKNDPVQEKLVSKIDITAVDLHLLGLEYMKSKGKETEYTRFINPEFKKALNLK